MTLKPPGSANTPINQLGLLNAQVDYGARGDGTTEEAAVLQWAFDQASRSNRCLYIPPGTYKCNSGLVLSDSIDLWGAEEATFDFSGCAQGTTLITLQGSEGTAYGLTGNAAAGATSATVSSGDLTSLGLAHGDKVKIGSNATYDPGRTNSKIGEIAVVDTASGTTINFMSPLAGGDYNTADSATIAKITPITGAKIRGGKIKGGGSDLRHIGLRLDRATGARVQGVRFENVHAVAVYVIDCTDCHIDSIHVTGSNYPQTGYGTDIDNGSQDCSVTNSYFRDVRHAVTFGASATRNGIPRRHLIQGNRIFDTTGDALDTHACCEDIQFIGNSVYDAGVSGINIENSRASAIGNLIVRSAVYGILMGNASGAPTDYACNGNRVIDAGSDGIRYSSNGSPAGSGATIRSVTITGNTVYNSVGIGIRATSSDTFRLRAVSITGNVVTAAQNLTASIYLSRGDYATVSGNTVIDVPSTAIGIRLSDWTKSAVTGNTVLHTAAGSAIGIYILTGIDLTITGNSVATANKGIVMDNLSNNNSLFANNLRGCATPLTVGAGAGHIYQSAALDAYNRL